MLKKAMAPHSSTLAWKIPWTEEPGGLQSMGSLRVRHDFTFTFHFHALEREMATHSSVLAWRNPGSGEPGGLPSMGLQSWTRLKRLSSSSSSCCFYVRIGQSSQVGPLLAYRMDPILTFSSTCSTQLVGALRLALNRSRMLGLGSRAGWLRPRKGLSHRTGR